MYKADDDWVQFFVNLLLVSRVDDLLSPSEETAIESARARLGAKKNLLNKARKAVESGAASLRPVGSLGAQIVNLEIMAEVAHADGVAAEEEVELLGQFRSAVGITDAQFESLMEAADQDARQAAEGRICGSCGTQAAAEAKFCPECGAQMGNAPEEAGTKLAFTPPPSGYTVEFSESTAGGFDDAIRLARSAPIFDAYQKGSKTWYWANWPKSAFDDACGVASKLRSMRNKKVYIDGELAEWDETFGFLSCAQDREKAFDPISYCFGADEGRVNPWGCHQLRMDWVHWSDWLTFGEFQKAGLRRRLVWRFDKKKINHELNVRSEYVRTCPHLRQKLIDAVVEALPDTVQVGPGQEWEHRRSYHETPGAVRVTEERGDDGFTYKDEYWSDGVQPRDLDVLRSMLKSAFKKAGVKDVDLKKLLKS